MVARVEKNETEKIFKEMSEKDMVRHLLRSVYIYAEQLINIVIEKAGSTVMGGERIKAIKYADDLILLAESEKQLQCQDSITRMAKELGMNVNVGKTSAKRK